MDSITLSKDQLHTLINLCNTFEVDSVIVNKLDGAGIGYTINAEISTVYKGYKGKFVIEIAGCEQW